MYTESEQYFPWPGSDNALIHVGHWVGDNPVGTHKHDFFEIAFLTKGSCMHEYLGSKVRLIPGDIFVVTPHENHSYEVTSMTEIYNCLFFPGVLGEDWQRLRQIKGVYDMLFVEPFYRMEAGIQEILHLSPFEAEAMKSILKILIDEEGRRMDGFELIQKSYLTLFLCTLGRAWEKQFSVHKNIYSSKRSLLADALIFIENNICDPIRIKDLVANTYCSPSHFRKVFKEATGLTPIDYINNLRISYAKQLLTAGKMSVSDVAEAVGISDINYFSRLFKSYSGYTPSEYRKKSELC